MSDYSELKRLAESATLGPWQAYGTHGRIFVESMHKEAHVVEARPTKKWINDSAYIAAANPAAVLALIAEVEQLRGALCGVMGQVDGNIRVTVRDCVNGMDDVQDIYEYCDNIEAIVDLALSLGDQP